MHGLSRTSEYKSWQDMRQRCYNPKNKFYPYYGGRGITVCIEWHSFEIFIYQMGLKPSKEYSLDRINNDGNYEKSNCRWATKKEQIHNRQISFRYQGKDLF
jgi:hypothetical protein